MKSEKIFSGERKVLAAGIVVVLLANAAGLTQYISQYRSAKRSMERKRQKKSLSR